MFVSNALNRMDNYLDEKKWVVGILPQTSLWIVPTPPNEATATVQCVVTGKPNFFHHSGLFASASVSNRLISLFSGYLPHETALKRSGHLNNRQLCFFVQVGQKGDDEGDSKLNRRLQHVHKFKSIPLILCCFRQIGFIERPWLCVFILSMTRIIFSA